MAKAFFSHASEDKAVVETVYSKLLAKHPEHQPWLDRYEIVGGESLIDKIAEGMDESEKFFIFLSPVSVEKPWVQVELKRALMREINGVDPGYIVPVKIGELETIPPFLENKLYIDLGKLTEDEWLAAFDSAITGARRQPMTEGIPNVRYWAEQGPEGAHVAHVFFEAQAWAEKFSFFVKTSESMVEATGSASDIWPGGGIRDVNIERSETIAALSFASPDLRPGEPLAIRLQFPEGIDAIGAIKEVGRWQ